MLMPTSFCSFVYWLRWNCASSLCFCIWWWTPECLGSTPTPSFILPLHRLPSSFLSLFLLLPSSRTRFRQISLPHSSIPFSDIVHHIIFAMSQLHPWSLLFWCCLCGWIFSLLLCWCWSFCSGRWIRFSFFSRRTLPVGCFLLLPSCIWWYSVLLCLDDPVFFLLSLFGISVRYRPRTKSICSVSRNRCFALSWTSSI